MDGGVWMEVWICIVYRVRGVRTIYVCISIRRRTKWMMAKLDAYSVHHRVNLIELEFTNVILRSLVCFFFLLGSHETI